MDFRGCLAAVARTVRECAQHWVNARSTHRARAAGARARSHEPTDTSAGSPRKRPQQLVPARRLPAPTRGLAHARRARAAAPGPAPPPAGFYWPAPVATKPRTQLTRPRPTRPRSAGADTSRESAATPAFERAQPLSPPFAAAAALSR